MNVLSYIVKVVVTKAIKTVVKIGGAQAARGEAGRLCVKVFAAVGRAARK